MRFQTRRPPEPPKGPTGRRLGSFARDRPVHQAGTGLTPSRLPTIHLSKSFRALLAVAGFHTHMARRARHPNDPICFHCLALDPTKPSLIRRLIISGSRPHHFFVSITAVFDDVTLSSSSALSTRVGKILFATFTRPEFAVIRRDGTSLSAKADAELSPCDGTRPRRAQPVAEPFRFADSLAVICL